MVFSIYLGLLHVAFGFVCGYLWATIRPVWVDFDSKPVTDATGA